MKYILCFCLCALALVVSAAGHPTERDLSASDWSSLRAAYDSARHAFVPQADGTHTAWNHPQSWRSSFDARGFTVRPEAGGWEWGLELRAYSLGGTRHMLEGTTFTAADANRLSRARDPFLEEWFVNDERGLEQGWTFQKRPTAAEDNHPMRLHLAVRGSLRARSVPGGTEVEFFGADGSTVLSYGGLKAWDAAGRVLPSRMFGSERELLVEVDEREARYPITIDPVAVTSGLISQRAYLKASNTGADDQFGFPYAVAVSGDTVVIGAQNEDSNATGINGNQADNSAPDAGAAYVFVRTGGTWTQQAYLKASNTDAGDLFGSSVGISGDTIVVGAYAEASNAVGVGGNQADNSLPYAGAVYVFVRTAGVWSQQAYLKPSTNEADIFGIGLAISGDTIAVGAYLEDSAATGINGSQASNASIDSGAVYVFTRTGVVWSQQAYIKPSNTGAGDNFGRHVSLSDETLVATSRSEDSNATGVNGNGADNSAADSGAAYVFVRTAGIWSQQAYLKASNTQTGDLFGQRAVVSGDTIVVGAPDEDSNATGINGDQSSNTLTNSGAAYVFERVGAQWVQQAYVKATNPAADEGFASFVAVSGDTVIAGARGEDSKATGINGNQADNGAADSGAAYLYTRANRAWRPLAYLKASNTGAGDGFGRMMAIDGDLLVVSASDEASSATGVNGDQSDNSAPGAGAAYVFSLEPLVTSLAKKGYDAPGAANIAFNAPGGAAVNDVGRVMFDQSLTGTGSSGGKNRGAFSTLSPLNEVDLLLQSGTNVAALGAGLPLNAKVTAITSPVVNQDTQGLLQLTVSGTGITGSNSRVVIKDDGSFGIVVHRTGQSVSELGGAETNAIKELLQSHDQDLIVISHTLKPGTAPAPDVTAANDSGLLLLNHAGTLVNATPPREGAETLPDFGTEDGNLLQFTGRAAAGLGDIVHFGALFKPVGGSVVSALFSTREDGSVTGRTAKVGAVAPGAGGTAKFSAFPALSHLGANALFRATLSGSPAAANEGLWEGGTLRVRKGDPVDAVNLPGVVISGIKKFWPVSGGQIVLQVTLAGTGVNGTNNSALLLRQVNGVFLILLRTGQPANGAITSSAKVGTLQAVDVDPQNGHYVVQSAFTGAPSKANQGLWTGQTTLGDDTANRNLRLPLLRVRKGDLYTSTQTILSTIKSIALKPATDTTGAGGRGLAQVIGSNGYVVVQFTGDRGVHELVLLTQ